MTGERKEDLILGDIAVKMNLVNETQVQECLKVQKTLREWKPLGVLLMEKGYLSEDQLQSLVDVQSRNIEAKAVQTRRIKEDNIFGRIAIKLGFATEAQVDECLGVQLTMQDDYFLRLGEILLKRKYLTEEQVQKILDYQTGRLITCSKCGHKYNTILFNSGAKFVCYKCDNELTVLA